MNRFELKRRKAAIASWFLGVLEKLGTSHGARALARTQRTVRGLTFEQL